MNDDAKPYASEELRLHRTAEDVRPRLRATVEALERVTKERDSEGVLARDTLIKLDFAQQVLTQLWAERAAALAACAEMRAVLTYALVPVEVAARTGQVAQGGEQNGNRIHFEDARDRIRTALASDAGRGWVSPEEHARVLERAVKAETRLGEVLVGAAAHVGLVSPEAFDAALREVAEAAFRWGAGPTRGFEIANLPDPLDAIIAAAKAKHGGAK